VTNFLIMQYFNFKHLIIFVFAAPLDITKYSWRKKFKTSLQNVYFAVNYVDFSIAMITKLILQYISSHHSVEGVATINHHTVAAVV